MKTQAFQNRHEAGQLLSRKLTSYTDRNDVIVLGLPRGGIPVAYEVARRLDVPLDAFIVRKLGVPGHEELAMGAIASGNVRTLNRSIIQEFHIPNEWIEKVTEMEKNELLRRNQLYRDGRPFPDLQNQTVIIVDDGIATGSTMRVAVEAVRSHRPAQIVVATPVISLAALNEFGSIADQVVAVSVPVAFYAVGEWYEDFSQTTDEEVVRLLDNASSHAEP